MQRLKVCLIANQIAAWDKIGGFGTATRALGRGLVDAGVEVAAVVPRRAKAGQAAVEQLDGITVYGMGIRKTLSSGRIFSEIDADIYHSQEPTIVTRLAQRAVPDVVHVVTCRDPRGLREHLIELRHANYKRRVIAPATWLYEASPMVKRSVRNADAVFMSAPSYLTPKIRALYGGDIDPEFVSSPVDMPDDPPVKSPNPLALFVGRWDRRKRIERFFELTKRLPDVRFVAVGRAHDGAYDARLREQYGSLPNLELPGFLSRFGEGELQDIYDRAWVLINTSAREGLPYTFLEAGARGCAILSGLDPEHFVSRFGHLVAGETVEDLEAGLLTLLDDEEWRRRGRAAAEYVRSTYGEAESLRRHLERYQTLLGR